MNPIAGYSIRETLFTSAKSIIYRATRTADARPVIVKVLNAEFPSTEQVARLHREYRLTRALAMEGVIEVLGLERFGTSVAILLEDFGGESLTRLHQGPMALPRLLGMAARLADILGHVHQRQVIHKDITPSNIVWNPSTDVLKLIDFGIATELLRETPAVFGPGVFEGTLPYMSPEATGRMNRAIDYRTDLYSLGVTLYELLTGQLPFTADDPMELVHCHIARVPVPPHELVPGLPPVVSSIVMRLLSKRAEDRYQSAFALARDLRRCLQDFQATGGVAPFELGRGDVPERLQLSQKLYGRQRELEELLATFDRASQARAELMLVAGYSGIGKSALVHEVHKPIVKRRGYFVSGKFDQFNRDIPYASLLQAFQELMRQLLAEPTERLAHWKEKLLGALGPNASVIVDVIPEVAFILGPQPRAPELSSPSEERNRFHLVMEGFVRTFAGPEHPLVVFLDDLQWADQPSLELLERLLTEPGTRHLLVIGAYRDNEVDASHPLLPALAQMRKAGTPVSTITLGALGREHCLEVLVDALGRPPAEVEPLAELCLRKTEGNPFFLGQFLLSLHQEGMIRFDAQAGGWAWDMDRIVHTPMTDNVVALMATKIQKLPEDTQRTLCLAACIGNTFDLKTLAIVDERSAQQTADSLWAALREGLLLPLGDAYKFIEDRSAAAAFLVHDEASGAGVRVAYRFLHDRVQQAAYSLIPEDARREVHLRIGRMMCSALTAEERDAEIFTIVGHLNQAAELLTGQAERDEVAALNLLAGRKAQSSAAHVAALGYLEMGLSLLGPECWTRCYEQALRLHTHAVEACFLCTDFQRMEHHAAEVLEHARGTIDQVRVYEVKIEASIVQNRFKDAVLAARRSLALLGITLPTQPTPEDVQAALARNKALLGERSIEALIDLPLMTNPVMLAASRIFAISASLMYATDPMLWPIAVLRQIEIAVEHGNTGVLVYGYAAYGHVLAAVPGDFDSAYACGRLALRLLERYEAREYSARTRYVWFQFIQHWKEHVRDSLSGLQAIYQTGLEVGDLEFAGWSVEGQAIHALFVGQELAELDRSTTSRAESLAQIKQASALQYLQILHQVMQNLRGLSGQPSLLIGAAYDESKMLPVHLERGDAFGLALLFIHKLELCVLFGRHAEALENAVRAEPYMGAVVASTMVPSFHFFGTLARLALHDGMAPGVRERAMERINESVEKMKGWAGHAPMNYGAKHALMEAERHRVLGRTEQARTEYYRAIALAREHEYRNDEALATELFAAFLRQRGEGEVARLFLAKARHLYHLWGAEAKVRELDEAFPELRVAALGGEGHVLRTSVSRTTTSEGSHASRALDLASVLKASQAISGEVVLPELLKKLVRLVVENAGARSGLLVLEGERPLIAVARGSPQGDASAVTLHESLEQLPVEFSRAILRYVERTHEVLVLGDASKAEAFQSDPYVVAHRHKSVLCMPILHQKKRVGLLYLENELLANAFTPDHCQVLSLLAAQAAISLENAKLYDTLDTRVKERTRELSETLQRLQQTQKQLVLQEKLASLGSLTSGIAHEIKNPLNFVNNFAELTVSLVSELREELHPRDRAVDSAAVEQLLGDLEHNATKIHEHGTRADRIVQAMLEHARTGPGTIREANVNELVREYVHLALTSHRANSAHSIPSSALHTGFDESLGMAMVASEDLGRVILNLTHNALYALVARGREVGHGFTPLLEVTTRDLGDRFEIRVRDNGGGIPAQAKGRIFTPFFTTKPPGQGTGLGLSISHDIVVQGHGGTMTFTSEEGEGTEFVVALPKRASATTWGQH
ncbi:AAA family ATPase [Cystobacter fuscus]|uniref:trifunctional serine/threonine-protein kinase/ATP-binding protein/sensor histidine kinase n=1 Tax=Cystobacter fuscus TaxID=43 RepID=UPI002B289483|nr:AAA family ATPase [Cystobacter fuscus]